MRAAPDFVVEVVSPSTSGHDHMLKRSLYKRAAVREYWLVHPFDRLVTCNLQANGEYSKPAVQELAGETPLAVLPGVVILWDTFLKRLPSVEG